MTSSIIRSCLADGTPLERLRARTRALLVLSGASVVLLCAAGMVISPADDRGENVLAVVVLLPVVLLTLFTGARVVWELLHEGGLRWEAPLEKRLLSRAGLLLGTGSALAAGRTFSLLVGPPLEDRAGVLRMLGATATGTIGLLAIVVGGATVVATEVSRRRCKA